MSQNCLIGVDLGTSVVKTTLYRADGTPLAHAARDAPLHQPGPGLAEQRGEDFYDAALETIAEVASRADLSPTAVVAVAFDGQMGGAMGIDRDWHAVTPWYPSTLDTRYQPYLAQMLNRAEDRLMALGGALPLAAPRMLWWKTEYPELYKRIHKVLILANYVAGRMAGLRGDEAFIDPSYLTFIGLSDTGRRSWSGELAELWGLSLDKLSRVVPATTVVGHLSKDSARACGLAAGVPLVAGAGDQVAGFLGAGLVEAGQLIDVAGTFPVFATCLDRFVVDTEHGMLQSLAGPIPGAHWYLMMYIGGGGLTHRWFCNQFAAKEKEQARAQGTSVYEWLDAQAANLAPGAQGLLFIPHLAGRICPSDPAVRGAWLGFTWTHRKPHFYRALLESIAYDYAQALEAMRGYCSDVVFGQVRVIGGGASSALWNQIKADVLGLPYARLAGADRATLGCAIMAGHAVGLYPDMAETARQLASVVDRIQVRPAHHEHYRGYVAAYGEAFGRLRGLYETLAALGNKPLEAQNSHHGGTQKAENAQVL
jgi:xylulokinase